MIYFWILLIKFTEYMLDTLRISAIANSKKTTASLCCFLEIMIWAFVFRLTFFEVELFSLEFFKRIIVYGLGSAVGTYIVMARQKKNSHD